MKAFELALHTRQAMSDNFLSTFYPYSYEWTLGGNGFKSHVFVICKNTSTYRHGMRDVYQATRTTYGPGGVPQAQPEPPTSSVVLDLRTALHGVGYATLPELMKKFFDIAGADAFDQYNADCRENNVTFIDVAKYYYARRTSEGVDFDQIVKNNLNRFKLACAEIPGLKFKVIKPNSRHYFLSYGAFLGNMCVAVLKPNIFDNQWTVENPFESGGVLLQNLFQVNFEIFQQNKSIVEQISEAIILET